MKPHDERIEWSIKDMVEVTLNDPDDFLRVKETLTRIGISSRNEYNTLYQSCHILHKQGRYFIVHFKELFILDGKYSNFTVNDRNRRNTIAQLLDDWGLLEVVDHNSIVDKVSVRQLKIVKFKDKSKWTLVPKYNIGQVKKGGSHE